MNYTEKYPNQTPVSLESSGQNSPQKQYFTAEESMAFLEPRIRAMFK